MSKKYSKAVVFVLALHSLSAFSETLSVSELASKAEEARVNNDDRKAQIYYQRVLRLDDANEVALTGLLALYSQKNDTEAIDQTSDALLKINRDNSDGLLARGKLAVQDSEWSVAQRFLVRVIDLQTSEASVAEAKMLLSIVYDAQGSSSAAEYMRKDFPSRP
jgi:uncharacterized protein HemY